MSDALGSLVPVLAHSRRCGRAPALYARCQRGVAQQVEIRLIDATGDGDAEPVVQRLRNLARHGDVPTADEHRGHGADLGIEPGGDAPFDAAQIRLGCRDVLLARKQQRHVDRHARKDRLLDGRQTFLGAGNLDEQVGPSRPRGKFLGGGDGAGRVMRQQWRHLQRHPSVHAIRAVVNRPEQVGGPGEIVQCQIEKKFLAGFSLRQFLADRGVVGGAVLDGVIKDRRVRGQPGHRQFVDVALERAAVQQVARDVVEPEALAQVVKFLGGFHNVRLMLLGSRLGWDLEYSRLLTTSPPIMIGGGELVALRSLSSSIQ